MCGSLLFSNPVTYVQYIVYNLYLLYKTNKLSVDLLVRLHVLTNESWPWLYGLMLVLLKMKAESSGIIKLALISF